MLLSAQFVTLSAAEGSGLEIPFGFTQDRLRLSAPRPVPARGGQNDSHGYCGAGGKNFLPYKTHEFIRQIEKFRKEA